MCYSLTCKTQGSTAVVLPVYNAITFAFEMKKYLKSTINDSVNTYEILDAVTKLYDDRARAIPINSNEKSQLEK